MPTRSTGSSGNATKTVRAGKREAQRSLNEMIVEAERGLATRTTATVGELLDRRLELAREDFAPRVGIIRAACPVQRTTRRPAAKGAEMTCYVLAHVEVVDPTAYGVYAAAVIEQLSGVGGRVLAAGPANGLEGAAMTNHNVVLEFADEATARSWFESDAYQAIVPLRRAASASSQISILPGWDGP